MILSYQEFFNKIIGEYNCKSPDGRVRAVLDIWLRFRNYYLEELRKRFPRVSEGDLVVKFIKRMYGRDFLNRKNELYDICEHLREYHSNNPQEVV